MPAPDPKATSSDTELLLRQAAVMCFPTSNGALQHKLTRNKAQEMGEEGSFSALVLCTEAMAHFEDAKDIQ